MVAWKLCQPELARFWERELEAGSAIIGKRDLGIILGGHYWGPL